MRNHPKLILLIILNISSVVCSQSLFDSSPTLESNGGYALSGYVRALAYSGIDSDGHLYLPSGVGDLGIIINAGDGIRYRAYIDSRYRYGVVNDNNINSFRVREAWAGIYSSWIGITVGQQVIKWGKAEFVNRSDFINPKNDLVRSPDPDDRDIGNIISKIDLNISDYFTLQLLGIPFYRSSELYTDFMDIGSGIVIHNPTEIRSDRPVSLGLKATVMLKGFDASLYWYDGQNILPGVALDTLILPTQPGSNAEIVLEAVPYSRQVLAFDMATAAGSNIIKSGLSFSTGRNGDCDPVIKPLDQFDWFVSYERSLGNWNLLMEYSGSRIINYKHPVMDPIIPTGSLLNNLPPMPPEDIGQYISSILESFNRLYNYQYEETYHIAGVALTGSNSAMSLKPELRLLYNFTTEEIMIQPRLHIVPYDNVSLSLGLEYWQGPEKSLFQLIHKKVNGIFAGIKISF